MPDISIMKNSKFLAQGDCKDHPILLTMTSVQQENVAKEGAEAENKWTLCFEECEKPLVLNRINMELIAQITGSTNTDNWRGKKIVLYSDPTIQFGGKLVGGLRVRAPKTPKTAPAAAAPAAPAAPGLPAEEQTADDDSDSVPF